VAMPLTERSRNQSPADAGLQPAGQLSIAGVAGQLWQWWAIRAARSGARRIAVQQAIATALER